MKKLLLLSLVCISSLLHTMEDLSLPDEAEQHSTEEELSPKPPRETVTNEHIGGNWTIKQLQRGASSAIKGGLAIAGAARDGYMGVSVTRAIKKDDVKKCIKLLEKDPAPTDEEVTELIDYAIEKKHSDILLSLTKFFAKNKEESQVDQFHYLSSEIY